MTGVCEALVSHQVSEEGGHSHAQSWLLTQHQGQDDRHGHLSEHTDGQTV